MSRKTVTFSCLAVLAILSACGSGMIGESKVPATQENLAIDDVLVRYKLALEAREPDQVLALVSPRYLENGSTTDDPTDDYGYQELADEVLPKLLNNVKAIQFEYRLLGIHVIGEHARVQYEYTTHFLFAEGGREGWHSRNDLNEIQMVRDQDDDWRILSGL
jgi:hypothetical protein